MAQSALPKYIF